MAGKQWKHLEFTLAHSKRFFALLSMKPFVQALLSTYWFLRTRKHKANRYFRACNMFGPETMPMSRIVEKLTVLFSKQSSLVKVV